MTRDADPTRVLKSLGIPESALLGSGSEAQVYALDARRAARIHGPGVAQDDVTGRASLLSELDNPTCLKIQLRDGRAAKIWEYVWDLYAVDDFWS